MVDAVYINFVSDGGEIVSKVAEVLVRALVLCLRHCGATWECRLGWRLWVGWQEGTLSARRATREVTPPANSRVTRELGVLEQMRER